MAGTVAFTGGSLTAGVGWNMDDPDQRDKLWVNLVHQGIDQFKDLALINAAESGVSNTDIFIRSLELMTTVPDLKYLVCSWVVLMRYRFSLGLELYETHQNLHDGADVVKDHDLNTGRVPKSYIDSVKNRFFALHHDHYEICKLLKFVNIINNLAHQLGITVYHINDSLPWDKNYFARLNNVLPEDYTNYTKTEILNIKNRDDAEIFALYKKIHDEYDALGGCQPQSWVNLYESLEELKLDHNNDNYHPGTQSNVLYFEKFKAFLNN